MDYDKGRHSIHSLNYHLVLVVKYRKKVFQNKEIISFLKSRIESISQDHQVKIIEQQCDQDHIHILFSCNPTCDMIKYIGKLKGVTSRNIRSKFKEEISKKLYGDAFWAPSYFLATSGNVSLSKLMDYVKNQ